MAQWVSWWRVESWSLRSTAETWLSTVWARWRAPGDLLVAVAAGDQPQHLAFTGGQQVEVGIEDGAGGGLGHGGEGVEHEPGQARREDGVAPGHPVDGLDELGPDDLLGDVAAGAGPDHADHVLGRVRDREGEELHLGVLVPDGLDDRPAAAAGHMDVEQDDVGQALEDQLDGGRASSASPMTLDRVGQLARMPARKRSWSSTKNTRGAGVIGAGGPAS